MMSVAELITSRLATRVASSSGIPSSISSAWRTRTVPSIDAGRTWVRWFWMAAMRGRNSFVYAATSSFS